eukprot:357908-Chlamydomonas_euryale.AAC.1
MQTPPAWTWVMTNSSLPYKPAALLSVVRRSSPRERTPQVRNASGHPFYEIVNKPLGDGH